MKKIKTDFLIIGAGLYGCVLAERISTVLKKKVTILERRKHIGGNCYSEVDKKTNIEYHKYGTHIFHTSIQNVWDYFKDFTKQITNFIIIFDFNNSIVFIRNTHLSF